MSTIFLRDTFAANGGLNRTLAGQAWRRASAQNAPTKTDVSLGPPVGPAVEGAVHYQVDSVAIAVPV